MRKMTISQSRFGRVQRPLLLLATLTLMAVALAAPLAAQETTREAEVTFTKDVAPILQRSCVQCHRPGQVAPMSLLTYQDARPWARAIKQRVQSREMPPWNIDRRIGIQQFKNDPSLSDHEIATLGRWVDRGAPMGDPADMPPQREFADADAWQIGTPDLIVRYPTYTVPAAGPDLFGNLTADFNLQEDRYIKAIQTKPVGDRSRQVVHHALSYAIDPTGEGETMDAGQFLVEYASGKNAEVYPEDSGLLLQGIFPEGRCGSGTLAHGSELTLRAPVSRSAKKWVRLFWNRRQRERTAAHLMRRRRGLRPQIEGTLHPA